MPLTMTVRPPLTLPLTVPVDDLARFHRFFQRQPRGQALGLVARQDGVAEAVFQRFDRDGNEVAGLDFEFAAVVLEFFDRDVGFGFRPALTTTKLWSTRTTSAEITSPMRMSLPRQGFPRKRGEAIPYRGLRTVEAVVQVVCMLACRLTGVMRSELGWLNNTPVRLAALNGAPVLQLRLAQPSTCV